MNIIKTLIAALAVLCLTGCFDDDDGGGADPQTMQTMDAAGGQLVSPDGNLTLTIPPGALAAPTEITIVETAPGNQPDAVRWQTPDRVYQLEPSGLIFTLPVTISLDLPPSAQGELAFALLHTGGTFEPLQELTLTYSAGGRLMTAELSHFSELLVLEESGTSVIATVSPRSIEVGETLDATLSVSKEASGAAVTVDAELDYISTSNPLDLVFVNENLIDFYTASPPVTLAEGAVDSKASLQTWQCVNPHTGVMRFNIGLQFPMPIVDIDGNVLEISTITVSRLEPAEIDYICNAGPPGGALQTGLFTVPFGMTSPDGVHLIDGAFANLGGSGPFILIAGNNGAVVMDLTTGLSALNMTPGAPDGRLGAGALLGALPVSQPSPGPATVAGFFASGAGGAVRSYTPDGVGGFVWGATLLINSAVLDASAAGGGLVTDEVLTTEPQTGLNAWSVQSQFWQFNSPRSIPASRFTGTLVSAAVPIGSDPVLALTTGTDGGTTSTVSVHDHSVAQATALFTIASAAGRRLRCLGETETQAPLAGRALCGATEAGGTLSVFVFNPAQPTAVPTVSTQTMGLGALGLAFGLRSSGTPVAVVANLSDETLNLIDFNTAGAVTGNQTVAVPAGCTDPPHAVPVAAGGDDYIAGSCNGSGQWYVMPMPAPAP